MMHPRHGAVMVDMAFSRQSSPGLPELHLRRLFMAMSSLGWHECATAAARRAGCRGNRK